VLGEPERGHADGRGGQARDADGGEESQEKGPARLGGEEGGGVGADAEEGGMGERQAAHVTDHEVVAEGEGGEEAGEDEDVQDVALLAGHHRGHQPGQDEEQGGSARRSRAPHGGQMPIRRPNRPYGRQSRKPIIMTKAMASLKA
jgi:hypothetical protein